MNRIRHRKKLQLHGLWLKDARMGARADFRRAVLRDEDFTGANLGGADFRRADLGGADLRGAGLSGADFYRADLRDADLTGADLRLTQLYDADLTGCRVDAEAIATSRMPLSWWLEMGAIVEE